MTSPSVRLSVFVLLLAAPLSGHQEPSAAPSGQPFAAAVSAIVVDVVVRDRQGNPVTDLTVSDFELLEDGVRQQVGDVVLAGMPRGAHVSRAGQSGSAEPPTRAPRGEALAAHGAAFTALVFDRLSPEARAAAYSGALAWLEELEPDDFAAVYLSDLSLATIQTYTNDRARLRRALEDVASRATSVFDRDSVRDPLRNRDPLGDPLPGDAHPGVPHVASAESIGRPVDTRFFEPDEREIRALELETVNSWEVLARDRQGYATTNALLAVTTALGRLPGRKTILFFAESLSIPDSVLPHFRNVVTNANRANVSVYTVDAAGVRVHSSDAETGRAVKAMGSAGLQLNPDGSNSSSLRLLERNEDVLRKDPRASLGLLARDTGGLLVQGTNDLGRRLREIDTDRRFHYLLTYTPANTDFNGEWRHISVRVPGRRVEVRARSGYLAVYAPPGLPLLAHEGPTLAALSRSPAPADLPVRAAALVFPDGAQRSVAVVATTKADALRFDRDEGARTYRSDFSILARVVDASGRVVRKSSEPYRLEGRLEEIDHVTQGDVLFFRQPALDAGTYTLEVAVHDALAGKSGVHRSTFVVPAVRADLEVGSLVIVARAERVPPDERQPDNPLYIKDVVVYPNVGEPLSASRDKALTFLVVAKTTGTSSPPATIEVLRDAQSLARAAIELAPPDATGRIEHVAQIPLDGFVPGHYTLRLTVGRDGASEVRDAAFEVVP